MLTHTRMSYGQPDREQTRTRQHWRRHITNLTVDTNNMDCGPCALQRETRWLEVIDTTLIFRKAPAGNQISKLSAVHSHTFSDK
jgi:hypothetical protein